MSALFDALALCLTLAVTGCKVEKVDEQAFRNELAGPWVQVDRDTVQPYWEFTRDGTIRDIEGKTIGTFASAGTYRTIHVEVQGEPPFTSEFAFAAQGKSISFVNTRFVPFTRVNSELRNRALLDVQQGRILANLESLAAAARTVRSNGGKRVLTYADLVGEGKPIPKMEPIAGEDYTKLELDGDSPLRVHTSYGMELTTNP